MSKKGNPLFAIFYPQCSAPVYSAQKSWILSETRWFLSLFSGSQRLDLCSALKETECLFCFSQLAGRSGIRPRTACSCCCEYKAESECIFHRLAPSGIQHKYECGHKETQQQLRNNSHNSVAKSLIMSLWAFNASVYSIIS